MPITFTPEQWATINETQDWLVNMDSEQRLAFLAALFSGYCKHCGKKIEYSACHCLNDE